MNNEKQRAIKFYLEVFDVVPWEALSDSDKIYYYKEADIFETDKQLEDYIEKVRRQEIALWK